MTEYERWLKEPLDDQDLTEELLAVKDQPEEINDRFYRDLEFGTGGLRGVIGAGTNRMNVYTVRKATQGLANYLLKHAEGKPQSVAIAHDSRNKGVAFARQSAAVLAANGIKAYLYPQLMPTPALSYAVRHLKCDAGICVTASHNPAKYNGYKAYGSDGCQVTAEMADGVMAEINSLDIFADVRKLDFQEGIDRGLIEYIGEETVSAFLEDVYKESLTGNAGNLKLVYTPLNGSGKMCVTRILDRIGVKDITVVPEQSEPDGNFPTCPYPNPEIREALQKGLELCEKVQPDLLLATDPDCDRVGVVGRNAEGEFVVFTGNQTGALLVDYFLKTRTGLPDNKVVIKTIVTSELGGIVAKSHGAEVVDVLTGFKYIGEHMTEYEATGEKTFAFGYEESYGYLAGNYARDKDAVLASALVCEMADYYKKQGMTLYDALEGLYQKFGYFIEGIQSMTLEGIEGKKQIANIMEKFRANHFNTFADEKLVTYNDYQSKESLDLAGGEKSAIDLPKSNVLKFVFNENSWYALRPSGTEPKLKVYYSVTGRSRESAEEKMEILRKAVNEIIEA